MFKDPLEYLRHIRDECAFIMSVVTESTTKDEFLADETLKRAVIRSIEVIGEAAKRYRQIINPGGKKSNGKICLE